MATVDKNFKVKHGLIVEGTTATVNGEDIITTGSTSDSLPEGSTNKYFTDDRAQDAVGSILENAVKTNIDITYNNVDNVLTITAENGIADSTTDDLTEGTTNKYFTDSRAVDAVEAAATSDNTANKIVQRDSSGGFTAGNITTDGTLNIDNVGSLSDANGFAISTLNNSEMYISSTNNISISSDGNLTLNSVGNVYKNGASGGNEIVTQNDVDAYIGDVTVDGTTGNTIADRIGSVASDLSTHIQDTSAHGVTGDVVGTSDSQTLTNKTFGDTVYFGAVGPASEIYAQSSDLKITAYENLDLGSYTGDVVIAPQSGDIILNANGATYISSVSAGNQVATNAYVDNAVSGLNWKQAVNLFATSNVPLSGNTSTIVIDGHAALDSTDTGYRLLLTNQSTATENGIYVYTDGGSTYTLTRSADADAIAELIGAAVFVLEGTQYGSTSWVQNNHYADTFDDLNWTQFSGGGSVTAGTGITVDGLEISVDRTTVDTWYDEAGAASTAETNANSYTDTGLSGKQDTLTAGNGIDISGNTISADTDNMTILNTGGDGSQLAVNTGAGLSENTTGVYVNVDGTTLTNSAGSSADILAVNYGTGLTANTGGLVVDTTVIADKSYVDTNFVNVADLPGQLDDYILATQKGANDGVATLDGSGQVPADQLGNVPDSFITALANAETNLAVFNGELELTATPAFDSVEINSLAKQFAATATISANATGTVYTWSTQDTPFQSAELLVRIKETNGTGTELSKVLLAVDSLLNIHMTEYGMVSTSGSSLGDISASINISNGNVEITVTPTSDSSVFVTGTLLG